MRITVGALAWIRPSAMARLFGLDQPNGTQAPYLWRLFGIRDVVIGTATLRASASERRAWIAFGMACDAADGAAAAIGQRDGTLPRSSAALVAVPAAAVGVGVWLLRSGR
jgi:hypothetical protein